MNRDNSEHVSLELRDKLRKAGYTGGWSFTEIWAALPRVISVRLIHDVRHYYLEQAKGVNGDTYLSYETYEHHIFTDSEHSAPSPAEAAGNLLLWCIENGHVEVKGG